MIAKVVLIGMLVYYVIGAILVGSYTYSPESRIDAGDRIGLAVSWPLGVPMAAARSINEIPHTGGNREAHP